MKLLGIDPGKTGALAIVERVSPSADQRVRLIDLIDVPVSGEGAKCRVDATVLDFIAKHKPDQAIIERAQAMPTIMEDGRKKGQGASSAFLYGRITGALEMAVMGMRVPFQTCESIHWKKAHGLLKTDKENSRQRAIHLFPDRAAEFFSLMKHHNRAEAALIAWYGVMLLTAGIAVTVSAPKPPRRLERTAGKAAQGSLPID